MKRFSADFGTFDEDTHQMNFADSQFLIGSVTKQFTAAALLKSLYNQEKSLSPELSEDELLENIKMLIHKPLSAYISNDDHIWQGYAPDWLNDVTLHQLLCHTSGIPNYTDDPSFNDFTKTNPTSLCDVIALFKNKDLEFHPGTQWKYSNSGYILLGAVVEKISGIKIEDYFERNFFVPLGMHSTFMPVYGRVPELKNKHPKLASCYAWDSFDLDAPLKEQPTSENMIYVHAAGAVISTTKDLHRWNVALYEKNQVLPSFLLNLLTDKHALIDSKAPTVFYSYGLSTEYTPELSFIGHHGFVSGYYSVLHYYPKEHVTLVILQNVF